MIPAFRGVVGRQSRTRALRLACVQYSKGLNHLRDCLLVQYFGESGSNYEQGALPMFYESH